MNRRSFVQSALSASAATILPAIDGWAAGQPALASAAAGYRLSVMATDWGFQGTVDQLCAAAKKEGYDGIELWWPQDKTAQSNLFAALKKHQLQVGFLCGGWQANPTEHLASFKEAVQAATRNSQQQPLYINCHSGRDYFSFQQNKEFIDFTTRTSKETGIRICHETHRSRILFAAHVTRQYIEQLPDLKLTLDVSHWCNVHESLLADQPETMALALRRVEHIHARIGHPEGPQVNDPRAPEWEGVVKQHFAWWDEVINRKRQAGEPMTILTEFGPADYMPTLPYTRQPLADQWAINVHMLQLVRKRYS